MATRDGSWSDSEADKYYDKLQLQCATREEFKCWFRAAQRCQKPGQTRNGRSLRSFCQDCTEAYRAEQTAKGQCVANT